jgi:hypothetical protein
VRDREWMFPAGLVLACQFFFCATVALTFGFYRPPPFTKYAATSLCFVVFATGAWMLWNLRSFPDKPTRHIIALDWSMPKGFALAMCFLWLQFVALTWGKSMLPVATSMWADVPLANAEAALLGRDAWHLLPSANWLVDSVYSAWLPTVGAVFAVLYFSNRPNRSVGLLAFFVTVGLMGTLGQYLMPSGGPLFYARLGLGDRFAQMPSAGHSRMVSDILWEAFQGRYISFATGISAFPSIHVATSTWMAVVFRKPVTLVYAVFIYCGSIMLGWHYALDGIAGSVGALLCYGVAKWAIRATEFAPSLSRRPSLR